MVKIKVNSKFSFKNNFEAINLKISVEKLIKSV